VNVLGMGSSTEDRVTLSQDDAKALVEVRGPVGTSFVDAHAGDLSGLTRREALRHVRPV
jgi:hypothetical protein